MKEIMEACLDIGKVTVERTLAVLVKTGDLEKIGGGWVVRLWQNKQKG